LENKSSKLQLIDIADSPLHTIRFFSDAKPVWWIKTEIDPHENRRLFCSNLLTRSVSRPLLRLIITSALTPLSLPHDLPSNNLFGVALCTGKILNY